MEGLYIRLGWPEYQEYQDKDGFKEHSQFCAETNEYFIEQDWAFRNQKEDEENENLAKALAYVRENVDPVDIGKALETMAEYRCPFNMVDDGLADKIQDLLEEYGADNDLPEGWWEEFGDLDDIVYKL